MASARLTSVDMGTNARDTLGENKATITAVLSKELVGDEGAASFASAQYGSSAAHISHTQTHSICA